MPCPSDFSALSKTYRNLLIVPPFECAWLADENLRFPEPGRGCITFEACANNDVTVVLKEKAGSKHYRTDKDPNYAIVFGSHRNRRFRIEVDGSTCFEAAAVLVSPSHFERFWISIYDGRITVGKGSPGQGLLFEWAHSDTTRKVEYIGLSSWDKHVGYRNISVLPFSKSLPLSERIAQFALASGGLAQFFERSEFADLRFRVGPEGHLIPVHQVVLACCCSKFSFSEMEIINLASVQYSVLRAFLQYMYTGRTQLPSSKLDDLIRLCEEFGLESLTSECNRVRSGWIDNAGETIVNLEFKAVAEASGCFISTFSNIPIDSSKLEALFCKGENTDVEILVGGSEFVMKAHKLILSAWSVPLLKMFTNGMWESSTTKICVRDVEPDVFLAMLRFMYCGRLVLCQNDELDSFLISLLILADRFGIPLLQHACSLKLIEVLSKESVCSTLCVATSLPYCELLQESCVEFFAKHFEDCIQLWSDLQDLDLHFVKKIIQSPDLCVSTEEQVLNAVISWASVGKHAHNWRGANDVLLKLSVEDLFQERLSSLDEALHYVRFALMPTSLLQELGSSKLSCYLPRLKDMCLVALEYLIPDKKSSGCEKWSINYNKQDRLIQLPEYSIQFSQRASKLKELFYICDGDSNGVLYFAGTSYGAHCWMNPALTKKVFVSASSPLSRFTDAKSLVSRQYQGTCFAGPCYDSGSPSSWWKIDLGENHKLMCNHYTVRQDGSVNYMRCWSLQGSTDDKTWMDLRVHYNDNTLSRAGQFASWPIHSANAYVPFQYFRIILTRPTTSTTHPWNLCMCYIELYGYFE